MANKVRISTIGGPYYSVEPGISPTEAVTQMERQLLAGIRCVTPDRPDLIVLPEMCDIPLRYTKEQRSLFLRERGTRIFEALAAFARRNRCYVAYPTLWETGDGRWTNSIRMIDRLGGLAGEYCKNHPVLAEMAEGVVCGTEAPIIECDFGRTACVICFDLNFDELRHTYAAARPDLILFSSMYHGGLMQQYWAYSCRSHFVSAIGNTFPSSIVSPVGHVLASSTNYCSFVSAEVNLDCALVHLDGHRGKLQAIRETYGTKAKVFDPGYLGSVLLSSETDDFTVNELIREFELEPLDRYFARSLAARRGTATQC